MLWHNVVVLWPIACARFAKQLEGLTEQHDLLNDVSIHTQRGTSPNAESNSAATDKMHRMIRDILLQLLKHYCDYSSTMGDSIRTALPTQLIIMHMAWLAHNTAALTKPSTTPMPQLCYRSVFPPKLLVAVCAATCAAVAASYHCCLDAAAARSARRPSAAAAAAAIKTADTTTTQQLQAPLPLLDTWKILKVCQWLERNRRCTSICC
jgi:hypothetical protein